MSYTTSWDTIKSKAIARVIELDISSGYSELCELNQQPPSYCHYCCNAA
jgi:hypothetical protein